MQKYAIEYRITIMSNMAYCFPSHYCLYLVQLKRNFRPLLINFARKHRLDQSGSQGSGLQVVNSLSICNISTEVIKAKVER